MAPSDVFINNVLSKATDMSSQKWKAWYESNRKYNSKWEETFVWVPKAADGSGAAYTAYTKN